MVLSVVLAAAVRIWLGPLLGLHTPYITFFLAIVFSAWIGGFRAGLAATLLSVLVADIFLQRPRFSLSFVDIGDLAAALLFTIEGVAISALGHAQRMARRRAESSAAEARASAIDANHSLAEVAASEIRKSTIIRVALDCIIVIDGEGRITEFNPAAEATFGYLRDQVIGHPISEVVIPPSLRELHHAGFARYLATGEGPVLSKRIEITAMRSSGEEFPIELAIIPTHVADRLEFTAYLRDISERKQAEEDLRLAGELQRAFVRDVLLSVTQGHLVLCASEHDLPTLQEAFAPPVNLSIDGGMSELRHAARDAARTVGISDDRIDDLITASSEAAMNAVVHVGEGEGQVYAGVEAGVVQVRVRDHGAGIELEDLPHATLRKGYTTAGSLGHGMKLMLETADRVYLLTGHSGTTILIEQDRVSAMNSFSIQVRA
jgi:PAS domain S-box-containing protein